VGDYKSLLLQGPTYTIVRVRRGLGKRKFISTTFSTLALPLLFLRVYPVTSHSRLKFHPSTHFNKANFQVGFSDCWIQFRPEITRFLVRVLT